MGSVCARCSEVKKGKDAPGRHPAMPESESDEGGSDGEHSEVAASSDEDGNHEEYKQGVEEILKTTGKNLKRGKTMAMKEAINTAKKYGLESAKISEAEKKLDEHKRQQLREETEKEVEAFFGSPACKDIAMTEKMAKKVVDADCSRAVIDRVKDRLEELIITRPMEEGEMDQARSYLMRSCRDFVRAATRPGGRQVVLLDLEKGGKTPVSLSLDPPLQLLRVTPDQADGSVFKEVPLSSLSAGIAKDDKKVRSSRAFGELEDEDTECAVAIRYEADASQKVFCFIEPTSLRRDRLIEAFLVLTLICGG